MASSAIPPLSIAIIACNEETTIARCIQSAAELSPDQEVIVIDSGSTDSTREIARGLGARVLHNKWTGHRNQKNVALGRCCHDWVLALDCDEEVSNELRNSIVDFFESGADKQFVAASMNRKVWFMGRWIKHGDWYPDAKVRLFRRSQAHWGGSHEHDKVAHEGDAKHLAGDLHHFSFPDTNRYIEKISVFSDAYLKRELKKGRKWNFFRNTSRPIWRFFRAYVIRRGFLDGFPGFWIATATAFQTFVRHSRTYEHENSAPPPELATRASSQLQSENI